MCIGLQFAVEIFDQHQSRINRSWELVKRQGNELEKGEVLQMAQFVLTVAAAADSSWTVIGLYYI